MVCEQGDDRGGNREKNGDRRHCRRSAVHISCCRVGRRLEERIPRSGVVSSHVVGLTKSHEGVSTILCQKNLTALLRRRRRADCRGVPAARRVRVATDKSRIIGVYPIQ
ncbi:hypothetical protein QTP88_002467 [Uroleucon formosanum]